MRNDRRKKIFPLILSVVLAGTMTPVYSADVQTTSEVTEEPDSKENVIEENDNLPCENENETECIESEVLEGESREAENPEVLPEEKTEVPEILPEAVEEEQTAAEEAWQFHHDHNEKCGYVEAQEEVPCDRNCSEKDEEGNIIHHKDCAYRPAVEEHPCKYEVEVEKKRQGHEADEAVLKELEEELQAKKDEEAKKAEEQHQQDETILEEQPSQELTAEQPSEKPLQEEDKKDVPSIETEHKTKIPVISKKPQAESNIEDKAEAETEKTDKERTEKEEKQEDATDDMEGILPDIDHEQEMELKEEKNDAKFYVSVPAAVTLTGDTDSFDIETSKEGELPDGNVLITVEGTESDDDDSFALYHESDAGIIWRYKLQIADQLVDKQHNEVLIPAAEDVKKAVIIPTNSNERLISGFYSGSITFHVEYQEAEQN